MKDHLSNQVQIWSIHDLERHYKQKTNGHWFDRDTMRFFKSRISEALYFTDKLIYFISSEQGPNGIRRYTLRSYDPFTGTISEAGLGFQGYKTLAAAKYAAWSIRTRWECEATV